MKNTLAIVALLPMILCAVRSAESTPATESKPAAKTEPPKPVCSACADEVPTLDSLTVTPWLEPDARRNVLPQAFHVTDQDGTRVELSALLDKPVALTFLYTRCENPKKCLLTAETAAKLQDELRSAGLDGKVRLLILTYDPEYDSPGVLHQYADSKQIRCDGTTRFIRPEPAENDALFKALNVAVNYSADRVNIHGLQLMLIDKRGHFVRSYRTLIWKNEAVVRDLTRLMAE